MFDIEQEIIPMDLDQMKPGPFLAAILNHTDVDRLSGHDRVVALRACRRMASHYQAQALQAMASISDHMHDLDDDFELAHRSAATEIRTALTLTRRAAEAELDLAIDTRQRLPQVWEALSRGDIDVRKAHVIASTTCHLDQGVARSVADQIVAKAAKLTTGQLRSAIAKLCLEADPEDAERVYEEAVEDRRMVLEANPTGTADLRGTDLPPDRAVAISRRINRLARRLKTAGETRTMDQLRADVFLDLLEGSLVGAAGDIAGGVVDIQVDLETLMNLADSAGDLAGYGPVVADIARQVTERQRRSSWQFTVTDPDSGQPIFTGMTRRRPTAGQRRFVEAHNRTCVFPGCRMPAADSDLDHRIPWSEGGATETANLVPLCRHDHCNRHHCGWKYEPLGNGDYRWISRLGHTYTTSGMPP